jgi:Na+/melibiose symporter-like transporter
MNAGRPNGRVAWGTIVAYGAPGVGAGYMYLILNLYVLKFSTDVLLIAPAIMGLIFGASRLWDAFIDPIAGYLSDRTKHRLGRRRVWLAASVVPIAITFVMVFTPPKDLSMPALIAWMAVAIIGFYSAMTIFFIPHLSLGAELTSDYHERNRLFGVRHVTFTLGSILALASMQIFIGAEQRGAEEARETAATIAWFTSAVMAVLIVGAVWFLRERADFQGRVNPNPWRAFADVWRNPHARLLIVVTFIENVGSAAIGVLTLYVAQYVVKTPQLAPLMILSYMIPSTISVPMWLPLARRFGKIKLWIFSMVLTGLAFGGMVFLPFLPTDQAVVLIFVLAVFAGLAAGCGGMVGPSIQGDVIDYDEYMTGERKEGSYFAVWNLVYKAAAGVMLMLMGFVLQAAGFVPNQPQTMTVQVAIVALYGAFPLVCYVIGAAIFARFKLDEAAHGAMRRELEVRRLATAA